MLTLNCDITLVLCFVYGDSRNNMFTIYALLFKTDIRYSAEYKLVPWVLLCR